MGLGSIGKTRRRRGSPTLVLDPSSQPTSQNYLSRSDFIPTSAEQREEVPSALSDLPSGSLPPAAGLTRTLAYDPPVARPSPLPADSRASHSTSDSPHTDAFLASPQPTPMPSPSTLTKSLESIALDISLALNGEDGFVNESLGRTIDLDIDFINSFISSSRPSQETLSSSLPSQLSPDEAKSLVTLICSILSNQLQKPAASPSFLQLCSPSEDLPLPSPRFRVQTSGSQRSLRKRDLNPSDRHLAPRQATQGNGSGPSAEGYPSCTAVSNAVLSCFPRSNTSIVQNTWSKFIWNNNYPTFIGARDVDIYLFNAQSETPVANWTSIANDRGMIGIYAGDSWFPPITSWQNGRNVSYPYFFVITNAGASLTGGEQHQSTFTVIQTAPQAAFVSASLASASLARTTTSAEEARPSSTPTSSLQNGSSDDSFPKWEIALIVILGTFALIAFFVAAYLAFNNARRRRQIRLWQQSAAGGSAGSVGSDSPMIQNNEGTALMANQKGGAAVVSARDLNSPGSSRPGSPLSANVASVTAMMPLTGDVKTTEKPNSESGDGPITSVDATIMADAFRKALRKPEFVVPGGEAFDDSGEKQKDDHDLSAHPTRIRESMHAQVVSMSDVEDDDRDEEDEAKEIMDRELASEGRSMTSVDNRKRPEVHS